jgi:hypothetical protein
MAAYSLDLRTRVLADGDGEVASGWFTCAAGERLRCTVSNTMTRRRSRLVSVSSREAER